MQGRGNAFKSGWSYSMFPLSQAMIQLSIAISITADHVTETWDMMGDNTHLQIILKA